MSLGALAQQGEEPSWFAPEGSRGVKIALSLLFVVGGAVTVLVGLVTVL